MARKLVLMAAIGGWAVATAMLISRAGPLDPPTGPVKSSYKTLSEMEPRTAISASTTPGDSTSLFKITQPGSYYLTGNVTGAGGKHGIVIAANNVTIDMCGFVMTGVGAAGSGITATTGVHTHIVIKNGSLEAWPSSGIDFQSTAICQYITLSRIYSHHNSAAGAKLPLGSIVSDCAFNNNGLAGLQVDTSCTISHCIAYGNSNTGFISSFACTYDQCSSFQNVGDGYQCSASNNLSGCTAGFNTGDGISVNNGSTVNSCTSLGNTLDGIQCSNGTLVINNNCDQNGNLGGSGAGIHATGSDNRIEGNHSSQADRGIEVSSSINIIVRNTCRNNTTDWVIAANNVFGPILDRRAPGSSAVNGFTAASSLGTTDANANFSF